MHMEEQSSSNVRANVQTQPRRENISAHPVDGEPSEESHGRIETSDLLRIAVVVVAALLVRLGVWEPFAHFSLIGWTAMIVGGFPIFKKAAANIVTRRMTMELSMSIAIVAALAIGEAVTALIILLFVQVAEILEGLTVSRGRRAIKQLLNLLPHTALMRRDGQLMEVNINQINGGDLVVVKPGTRIPIDGIVVAGNSAVDQSAITGESVPVEKAAGRQVFAGTVNLSGVLEIEVARVGPETAFGKIVEAVERAEKSRAPIQKTADRLAGYLVYFALGCALLTFIVTRNMNSTISVVIVAGACGVAAGTPLAILGAIGRSARNGAIIKGGTYLEALGTIDTVVLDKTGTLTLGQLNVVDVQPAKGASVESLLASAAIAERFSEHPFATAILRKASAMSVLAAEPDEFTYEPGKGIRAILGKQEFLVGSRALLQECGIAVNGTSNEGDGSSEVFVARDGSYLGCLKLADTLRPEAKEAIDGLRESGVRTLLLTGDVESVATSVAKAIGVDEVEWQLLPAQKLQRIEALLKEGKKVAMVGDGINDAPALSQATVGIAMGSGTDVARESADIVLLGNDLLKFVETVRIARRCRRIILTNFVGTLLVDGVGVGLAAFGMLNPLLAAFIHVSSELAFILNSARLLPGAQRA
jgi:heavy metal translocating P-type ATPase